MPQSKTSERRRIASVPATPKTNGEANPEIIALPVGPLVQVIYDLVAGSEPQAVADKHHVPLDAVKAFAASMPAELKGEIIFNDPVNGMFAGTGKVAAYNPSQLVRRRGLQIYDEMKRDDQVKASLAFKKYACLSSGWEITSPKEQDKNWEPVGFIDYALRNMQDSLDKYLLEVMTALDYGYSVTEKIFAPIADGPYAGKIGLTNMKTRRPHFIDFSYDQYGNLRDDGIVQRNPARGESAYMPTPKFVLFTHQGEFGNLYGRADLEAGYRPWWIKENAYRWMAMLLERFGIPPIFALYNPSGLSEKQIADIKVVFQRLQGATSGAIPRKTKDDLEMWSPQLGNAANAIFVPVIEMLNRDIARSLLMPGLLGLTADQAQGSLARSRVHFDAFMMTLSHLQGQVSREVMVDQIIAQLMALNYPKESDKPEFKFLRIDDTDAPELMTKWSALVDSGVVMKQKADEDHIRTVMGFPEREEDDRDQLALDAEKQGLDLAANPPPPEPPAPGGGRQPPNEPAKGGPQQVQKPTTKTTSYGADQPDEFRRPLTQYESRADFKAMRSTLDNLQSRHTSKVVKAMVGIRAKMLTYVSRSFVNHSIKAIQSVDTLRGLPQLRKAVVECVNDGYTEGTSSMKKELSSVRTLAATKKKPQYVPDDAINFLRARADFTVKGIDQTLVGKVRNVLMNAMDKGEPLKDTMNAISDAFEPWVGNPNVIRDGEQVKPYRIETIVRTNLTDAFNRGRIIEARAAGPLLQGFEYSAIIDDVTTDVCRKLDGAVFMDDDPNLDKLRPPRHFNCRSVLVPIVVGEDIDPEDVITDDEAQAAEDDSADGFSLHNEHDIVKYLCDHDCHRDMREIDDVRLYGFDQRWDRVGRYYSPDQGRDDNGKWSSDGGSGGGGEDRTSAHDAISKAFNKAGLAVWSAQKLGEEEGHGFLMPNGTYHELGAKLDHEAGAEKAGMDIETVGYNNVGRIYAADKNLIASFEDGPTKEQSAFLHELVKAGKFETLYMSDDPQRSADMPTAFSRDEGDRITVDHLDEGLAQLWGPKGSLRGHVVSARVQALVNRLMPRRYFNPDQERDELGRWTGDGAIALKETSDRAWSGEPTEHDDSLTKQDTGALGEQIALAWLRDQGMEDARLMNMAQNNFPVDMVQDHELIEVKTGLASNGASAQQWRATIGQPGKKESEWLKTASDKDKAEWNEAKQRAIMQRKMGVVRAVSKELGVKVKPATMTMIVNPKTRRVDVYKFSGFHQTIRWKSQQAKDAFIGSYKY